jgi:hypothetical protein
MGTINPLLQRRVFSFAQIEPNVNVLDLYGFVMSPKDERIWIREVAERAEKEGAEAGGETIRENPLPLPPLSEVLNWESLRLKRQAGIFRERALPASDKPQCIEQPSTIEKTHANEDIYDTLISLFQKVWNNRVLIANENTDMHELLASMAALGMLDFSPSVRAGQGRISGLRRRAEALRERALPESIELNRVAHPATIEEACPSREFQNSIMSSFRDMWSDRVMAAMEERPASRHSAIHTLWWSCMYERASKRSETLSDKLREVLLSESQSYALAERVRSYIDFIVTPVGQDTDIHDLYIAIATLGMLDRSALILAGRSRFPRMFAALNRYADSSNPDMRHCAAIALSSLARVLLSKVSKVNMVSESARVLASAMRALQRCGRDNPERDDLMAGLVRQAVLLIPHLKRRDDASTMTVALHEIKSEVFSDTIMSKAQGALHELARVRPRL